MRVFLYIRVSTREQAEEGYSIKEQEERLKAYAKAKDYTIVKTFTDPGYSGANLNRPALQELIKEVNNVDLVLVYKLDRLSRSQKDTLHLIEDVFLNNNVDFVSMNESFDTSTPFGRAMIGILSVFAQLEREQIKERLTMGRVARAKEGLYHGGDADKAPTGYDYIDGKLVVNPYESECVKYIFKECLKGNGAYLIFEGVERNFPGVIAEQSTVGKILKRRLYIGKIIFERKEYEGRHMPIITERDFNEVQNLISKRAAKFRHSDDMYLLTGLLSCGYCSARLAGKAGKKLKNGDTLKYYVCYSRAGRPVHMITADSCHKSYEPKVKLEDLVLDQIGKLKLKDVVENKSDNSMQIQELEKQLDAIEKQMSKTIDLFSLDKMPIDLITQKIEQLDADKSKIRIRINELNAIPVIDLDEIKKVVKSLSDIKSLDDKSKKVIISKLIKSIKVKNESIQIDWVF